MLRMEVFDHPTRMVTLSESAAADEPKGLSLNLMARATDPVGSRFASVPLALVLLRNPRLAGLTSALSVRAHGLRVAGHGTRITTYESRITAFLIGNKVTIEIGVTHRKQRRATNSNR